MILSKCRAVTYLLCLTITWAAPVLGQDDPLRHGYALIIGTSDYTDSRWPPLTDVKLQTLDLRKALRPHFDDVKPLQNPTFAELDAGLRGFLRTFGNSGDARLFIYYAGHGYTEVSADRNEYRGYITGSDTPFVDGTQGSFAAARVKAISMEAIRGMVTDTNARQVLFLFDSCFAGTVFAARAPSTPLGRLSQSDINRITTQPVREFITAGDMQERIPAHSPIPQLLINALEGAADPYGLGVVTGQQIAQFFWAHTRGLGISPRDGKLPGGYFDRGEFLFRVGLSRPLPIPKPANTTAPAKALPDRRAQLESDISQLETRIKNQQDFITETETEIGPNDTQKSARLAQWKAETSVMQDTLTAMKLRIQELDRQR
jgi:hypothetical protein